MYENNEGQTGKYIIQDLQYPESASPEFQAMYQRFSKRILWIDNDVCPGAFQMNTAWYYAVPEKDPIFDEHSHNSDELIGLFSGDPDNPSELDGEIIIKIDGQEHRITKSSLIFCPAGVKHQMRIIKVDRPIFHFSVVTSPNYDNAAYDA